MSGDVLLTPEQLQAAAAAEGERLRATVRSMLQEMAPDLWSATPGAMARWAWKPENSATGYTYGAVLAAPDRWYLTGRDTAPLSQDQFIERLVHQLTHGEVTQLTVIPGFDA